MNQPEFPSLKLQVALSLFPILYQERTSNDNKEKVMQKALELADKFIKETNN